MKKKKKKWDTTTRIQSLGACFGFGNTTSWTCFLSVYFIFKKVNCRVYVDISKKFPIILNTML